jgi:hypothetical protein
MNNIALGEEETGSEEGFLRIQWTYFKKGKNEINFTMNVYQTIILLFGMSKLGELPLSTLIMLTLFFVVGFVFIANRLGKYSTQKLIPSEIYTSPFQQDMIHYRSILLKSLIPLCENEEERETLEDGLEILERWTRKDGRRI